jgi:glycerophosphoryl diester phosphodiesterase
MAAPASFFCGFTPAAHRGASREFPENTLESFRRAREILPRCLLETDVRMTRDGAIVISHDGLLEMKTDGSGPVSARTGSEIARLDAGHAITFDGGRTFPFRGRGFRVPPLADALAAFPDARFSVDIKDNDPEAADRTMAVIREQGALPRVIVGSFHEPIMKRVRKTNPDAITSCSKREILLFVALQKLRLRAPIGWMGDALLVPEIAAGRSYEFTGRGATGGVRVITRGFIREAHRRGIPVLGWTINRPDNMRRLIEWGIDGIVTDRIDVLKEVMGKTGLS